MLTKPELVVLSALDEPASVSELATAVDKSPGHVSRTVSELVEKELVTVEREGRSKLVRSVRVEPVAVYRSLVRQFPHVGFEDLLTGTTIELLYFLDEPATVGELAERTGNYRNTVHRIVKRLQNRGILRKNAGTYVLDDEFADLNRFARSLASHLHVVNSPAPTGAILWETVDEFLVGTEAVVDDERYHLTGPHRLEEYGLPLLTTDRRHYFYSERRDALTVEDVVCHVLLVDAGARYKRYALLVLAATEYDPETLRERAGYYGVGAEIGELLDYLETRGERAPPDVGPWNEFEQLAAEYGVSV